MGSSLVSPTHLLLLALVALLLFGAKRLPEIGRSLGTGMREFKDSVTTNGSDMLEATHSELPPRLPAAHVPVTASPATATQLPAPLATPGGAHQAQPLS
jgi:sec-independent protein translocase protein TatA